MEYDEKKIKKNKINVWTSKLKHTFSFSCTGIESAEAWTSPRAINAVSFEEQMQRFQPMLSPPLSPPGKEATGPQRKLGGLKLITTFGDKNKAKYLGLDDDRTPMNNANTPIAESALSPGGGG